MSFCGVVAAVVHHLLVVDHQERGVLAGAGELVLAAGLAVQPRREAGGQVVLRAEGVVPHEHVGAEIPPEDLLGLVEDALDFLERLDSAALVQPGFLEHAAFDLQLFLGRRRGGVAEVDVEDVAHPADGEGELDLVAGPDHQHAAGHFGAGHGGHADVPAVGGRQAGRRHGHHGDVVPAESRGLVTGRQGHGPAVHERLVPPGRLTPCGRRRTPKHPACHRQANGANRRHVLSKVHRGSVSCCTWRISCVTYSITYCPRRHCRQSRNEPPRQESSHGHERL